MEWGKLLERSGLQARKDAPSGHIESIEQVAAAQQIEADRREQLQNLG